MPTLDRNELITNLRKEVSEMSTDPNKCLYCGDKAKVLDHIIPHSFLRVSTVPRQWLKDIVPACNECNLLLNNKVFDTLSERVGYLCDRVGKRYARYLKSEEWTEEELLTMAPGMRNGIREQQHKIAITRARLRTLQMNYYQLQASDL